MNKIIDLFGNDITEQVKKEELKKKYSERTKKDVLFDKMFIIARSEENLFGEKYSEEERKEAEEYIKTNFKKK